MKDHSATSNRKLPIVISASSGWRDLTLRVSPPASGHRVLSIGLIVGTWTSSGFKMSTNEYTHHERDPLIQRPTKKEARMARAQFLTLCWALFVIGWTDGSTGPLIPRIQDVYDVSLPRFFFRLLMNFCRSDSEPCLGSLYCNARSVIIIES